MPRSENSSGREVVPGRLKIGDSADVGALYPYVYFASLESIAKLSASELVDAVLRSDYQSVPATNLGSAEPKQGRYSAAQFVVSLDPPHRFDPELSMREPLELQVWPDGTFSVEIEFVGEDVRTHPRAGDSVRDVLAEWADARGWQLAELYNDRGRSLPDVWNARFVMPDTSASIADAVDFAGRATLVAESCRYGGESVERLLALLRSGEAEGLLGTAATSVFQPRSGLVPEDDLQSFELAVDVSAFANAVHGGLLVLGLEEQDGRVAMIAPFPVGDSVERIYDIVRRTVFPPPEGLLVQAVTVASGADPGAGLLIVHVPPQDRVLKPFLVHGAVVDARHHQQGVTMVERRDTTIYVQGIAALHAQIAAGRALLRRENGPDRRG
jgi:hypothetical protein